ncbi:MAG: thioredoxin domain-containing protein [Sphingomonas sp.]|nr:thioredoxin domain-containing protein [Sphingomonas sp.]
MHAKAPARPAAPQTNWLGVVAITPQGGVRQGNPDAPLALVEYGSRSCPTCGRFANEGVAALRANYVATGKVSYEYRDFWVHPQDPGLSVLGHCVPTASFFKLLDAMYAGQAGFNARANQQMATVIAKLPKLQQPGEWARRLGYVELMARFGVPAAKANQCLASQAALGERERRVREAAESGVRSTPTFEINGVKFDAFSWADLEPVLKASGA